MIFFIFEAEGSLSFREVIDEELEGAIGERMEVAAIGDVIESVISLKVLFSVNAFEEEAFDFESDLSFVAVI